MLSGEVHPHLVSSQYNPISAATPIPEHDFPAHVPAVSPAASPPAGSKQCSPEQLSEAAAQANLTLVVLLCASYLAAHSACFRSSDCSNKEPASMPETAQGRPP